MVNSKNPFGGTVLDMETIKGQKQAPEIVQVEAYWRGLRADGQVPARADVNPRGIRQALDYAFIIERIAPGIARFRLAGSHLSDLMGMEVRGMPLTSLFIPEARDMVGENLVRLFEKPDVIHFALKSDATLGRDALSAHMVLLPLRSDLGDVSRALGCFVAKGKIGRSPRRFNIKSTRCIPAFSEGPDLPIQTETQPSRPGFAEDQSNYRHAEPANAKHPHLRLVKNED